METVDRAMWIWATILAVALVTLVLYDRGRHVAHERQYQACLVYAREHVPGVLPEAWCEP